jgi:multiple sugar transport system ATP-binding protein
VALARALVREPTVFLLDEPLSNLDAQRRASARDELQGFQRRVGTTTIYVTHDQVEAMGMGDRIVVIDQGRIRQIGTPREIYEEPADTYVATFVGSPPMTLIPDGNDLLGFRPESFFPLEGGEQNGQRQDGEIIRFMLSDAREEYLGSEKLVYGEVNGIKAVARLATTAPLGVSDGGSAPFGVRREHLRVFDRESGLRRGPARPPTVASATPAAQAPAR